MTAAPDIQFANDAERRAEYEALRRRARDGDEEARKTLANLDESLSQQRDSKSPKPCPACGGLESFPSKLPCHRGTTHEVYFRECITPRPGSRLGISGRDLCGYRSPWGLTQEAADAAWDAMTRRTDYGWVTEIAETMRVLLVGVQTLLDNNGNGTPAPRAAEVDCGRSLGMQKEALAARDAAEIGRLPDEWMNPLRCNKCNFMMMPKDGSDIASALEFVCHSCGHEIKRKPQVIRGSNPI